MTVTTTVFPASLPRWARSVANNDNSSSPVATAPGVVDGEKAIGVAVEGEAEVGTARHDLGGEGFGVGGTAAVVDVGAVGVVGDGVHLGAEARQHLGRDGRGGAVGAVDHDAHAGEVAPLEHLDEMVHVAPPGVGLGPGLPTPWPTGELDSGVGRVEDPASSASMAASVASESLSPPAAKSLTPLSEKGLCDADTTAAGQPR